MSWRSSCRSCVRRAAFNIAGRIDSIGALSRLTKLTRGRYILAYHRVLPASVAEQEWCHPAIWIRPETLNSHLGFFRKVGRVVSLQELLSEDSPGTPRFAITFDDAWEDNIKYGLDVLNVHQVKACFFVATEAVRTGRLFWTEEVAQKLGPRLLAPEAPELIKYLGAEARQAPVSRQALLGLLMKFIEDLKGLSSAERASRMNKIYRDFDVSADPIYGKIMNWDQVKSLASEGHLVGSHSRTHAILRGLCMEDVDSELRESKATLEKMIGKPVAYFCFPNARYDDLSASRVIPAGYSHGFRMHNLPVSRNSSPALIPRFSASEHNSQLQMLKLRFLRAHFQRTQ